MTERLAEDLRPDFDAADQMCRYLQWRDNGHCSSTGRCFDIGDAAALARFDADGDPFAGSAARRP
ncbi:hypothetical protein [Thiocystis violacea]|uniref:hypothetical protein n=1 Tax=Thiocystis violacea TaxID=13725 RepID=UPI0019065BF4|nr:hypothetical protein [Thiocystis violacea]